MGVLIRVQGEINVEDFASLVYRLEEARDLSSMVAQDLRNGLQVLVDQLGRTFHDADQAIQYLEECGYELNIRTVRRTKRTRREALLPRSSTFETKFQETKVPETKFQTEMSMEELQEHKRRILEREHKDKLEKLKLTKEYQETLQRLGLTQEQIDSMPEDYYTDDEAEAST